MAKELVKGIYGMFNIDPEKEQKLYKQMKEFGAHQRNELAMLLLFIKEGDMVIDVGAHIGTFAIPFSKKVSPSGRVYAFEPMKETYSTLLENMSLNNCTNIIPIKKVLGSTTETLEVHIPEHEYGGVSFSKNIKNENTEKFISTTLDQFFKETHPLKRINLIKIDAEGMEYDVLLGGREALVTHQPILYFEVNTRQTKEFIKTAWKTERFLKKLGYIFFKNLGERNSNNDIYTIGKVGTLLLGGKFGDVLAIPLDHSRYPKKFSSSLATFSMILKRKVKKLLKK